MVRYCFAMLPRANLSSRFCQIEEVLRFNCDTVKSEIGGLAGLWLGFSISVHTNVLVYVFIYFE